MTNPSENVRISNPVNMFKPTGYSQVAEVIGGRLIYVAGQIALDQAGNLVGPGDMEAQARQVFENIKIALESCGATFANVIKFTIFTVDIAQLGVVREVRNRYIDTAHPPTSTAVEVSNLIREDVLLEIEAIAALPA
jgi:reactive intermediate/imine deaminase